MKSCIQVFSRWLTSLYDWWLHWQSRWQKRRIWNDLPQWIASRRHRCIWVATVNFCNAKCVFCGQHRFKRPSGTMPASTFESLAKQSYAMGIREADFTPPLGDPLLDGQLFERAKHARVLGFQRLYLTTNGILLSGLYRQVLESFDDIRISIGGLDSGSYREAYGVNKFDQMWDGLTSLIQENSLRIEPRRIHIFFRSKNTASEIVLNARFKALQNKFVTVEFTNRYDNWGGSVKESDLIGDMKPRTPPKKSGVPCRGLSHYFVEHQGNVRLCGCRFLKTEDDGLVVGNVNNTPLADILTGPRIIEVMEKFKSGESSGLPDVCRDCTLYRPMTTSFLKAHA